MGDREDIFKFLIMSAANNLENNKEYINNLNVFPVPDGDTGSNMSMTFTKAAVSVQSCNKQVVQEWVMALLKSARGNSGVILSQLMRGVAKEIDNFSCIEPPDIAKMARAGVETAYRAVMKPTEGTILTVARDMAEFAEENCQNYANVVDFLEAMVDEGKKSLQITQEILPILKQARVVDAGGMGLVILLEGMVHALKNNKQIERNKTEILNTDTEIFSKTQTQFKYCTECIINFSGGKSSLEAFKMAIIKKGDSTVVVQEENFVKVHIHTNNPEFILAEAFRLGDIINMKMENMQYQQISKTQDTKTNGFVSVASGEGLTDMLKELGVDEVVNGGQTMNPSAQDILSAIESVNAEIVFVLPNNKNIILTANLAKELSNKNVVVIPTKNFPEAVAALVAFDPDASIDVAKEAMLQAIRQVSCANVAHDSTINQLSMKQKDIIGTMDNNVISTGADPNEVALCTVQKIKENNTSISIISVFYGNLISKEKAEELEKKLQKDYPDCDVTIYYGGQPVYYYISAQ